MFRGSKKNTEYELRRLKEARDSLTLRLVYSNNGSPCYVDLRKEDIEAMIADRNLILEKGHFI